MNVLEQKTRINALLETISASSRACFAALCTERLRPATKDFEPESHTQITGQDFGEILDELWTNLMGNVAPLSAKSVLFISLVTPCEDEDGQDWSSSRVYREDAIAAARYAILAWQSGRVADAGWASSRVFDALDYYITSQTHMYQESLVGQEKEQAAGLMQQELSYQLSDIESLRSLPASPVERHASLRAIRRAAKDNAYRILEPRADANK